MDTNNYEFGIPYDPVEDWRKIFQGAVNIYKKELKNSKKIIEDSKQELMSSKEELNASKQEKLDMINNFYNQGISLNVIAKACNLSIEEVEKIVNKSKSKK